MSAPGLTPGGLTVALHGGAQRNIVQVRRTDIPVKLLNWGEHPRVTTKQPPEYWHDITLDCGHHDVVPFDPTGSDLMRYDPTGQDLTRQGYTCFACANGEPDNPARAAAPRLSWLARCWRQIRRMK